MTKLLLILFCAAALSLQSVSAQNALPEAQEPIPDAETNPERIRLENSLLDAVAQLDAGNFEGARSILDSLESIGPEDGAVQYYLGLCCFSTRDIPGAVTHFENASRLDTTNLWYRETLANIYVGMGEAAKAGELFTLLSEENPAKYRNAYTMSLMADAYRLKRDYDSFLGVLTDLATDPDVDDETKSRALLGALGGFDTRTLTSLLPRLDTLMQAYAAAEPASLQAHRLRMEIAALREDHPTVISECERLIEMQPGDTAQIVTCLSIIGDTLHSMGDTRKAYKTYQKALRLDPRNCPVLNNYAYYLSLERKRMCKAERMSKITIDEQPDNATYLDTYGWILYLRGKAEKAKPYFKHAMIYGGKDSAVILMHYAIVLEALGEEDLASYYRNLAESKAK
ncbi:MAG: tetratricopeptide repeat protein [Bacteroidales bacterium]|nr:tetratricopeptide repeat protein [Bacteroidales bacterium]